MRLPRWFQCKNAQTTIPRPMTSGNAWCRPGRSNSKVRIFQGPSHPSRGNRRRGTRSPHRRCSGYRVGRIRRCRAGCGSFDIAARHTGARQRIGAVRTPLGSWQARHHRDGRGSRLAVGAFDNPIDPDTGAIQTPGLDNLPTRWYFPPMDCGVTPLPKKARVRQNLPGDALALIREKRHASTPVGGKSTRAGVTKGA